MMFGGLGDWDGGNLVIEAGGMLDVDLDIFLAHSGTDGYHSSINNAGTLSARNLNIAPSDRIGTVINTGYMDLTALNLGVGGQVYSLATLQMDGGTIDVGTLAIGNPGATADSATQLNLHGGTINAGAFFFNEVDANNKMDVRNDGKLIFPGNAVVNIDWLISNGNLTGDPGLAATYDPDLGLTTVSIIPEPATLGLLGLGGLGMFIRRRMRI
jgi:hypothetical protein